MLKSAFVDPQTAGISEATKGDRWRETDALGRSRLSEYVLNSQALQLQSFTPQRLQYPLIEEYSLNHIRDPTIT